VESPLVTPDGNVTIGITSMNDTKVDAFGLEVALPSEAVGPFTKVLVATGGNRRLQVVEAKVEENLLVLRMPSFDTHASILALKDSGPLVSLELKGVSRGAAGLAQLGPNQTVEMEAVVHNPSLRKLAAGTVTLSIPIGWAQSAETANVGAIKPGGEVRCRFRIRTPEAAVGIRIHPILARYQSGSVKSTPATEMVWWKP
jgi:hypothetical protein